MTLLAPEPNVLWVTIGYLTLFIACVLMVSAVMGLAYYFLQGVRHVEIPPPPIPVDPVLLARLRLDLAARERRPPSPVSDLRTAHPRLLSSRNGRQQISGPRRTP